VNNSLLRKFYFCVFAALVAALSAVPAVGGNFTYSDYGSSGAGYYPNFSQFAAGPSNDVAEPFTMTGTGQFTLTDVILPLSNPGSGGTVTVYVESNSSTQASGAPGGYGTPSGTILGTLFTAATISSSPGKITFTCSSCQNLTLGTKYWLVVDTTPGSLDYWYYTNGSGGTKPLVGWSLGWTYFSGDGPLAFEVDGKTPTATPEPASVVLLGTVVAGALLGSAGLKRVLPLS